MKQRMKNNLEDFKKDIDEVMVEAMDLCEDIYRTYGTIKQQLWCCFSTIKKIHLSTEPRPLDPDSRLNSAV